MTHPARRIWSSLEAIHAVTYFSPVCEQAMVALGLKGFWMGYFAGRAAPMGAVGAPVIRATFYNFAPSIVQRAVPEIWDRTVPEAALTARSTSAAAVLRDCLPGIEELAEQTVPLLARAVEAGCCDGRVLFAANQALPLPADPVAALWQCATSLREQRGDGHIAALVAAGISGIECHQLVAGSGSIGSERLRLVRGWTEDEWEMSKRRLVERGLLDDSGMLSEAGTSARSRIELLTDELAMQPYTDGLTDDEFASLSLAVHPAGQRIVEQGLIPIPNPIGFDPS